MQELTLQSRIALTRLPARSALWVCLFGGGWVVLWCSLNLAPGCVGSGASQNSLCSRPSSAAACTLPRATGMSYKVICVVAACTGLGGAWERLSCKLRLIAANAKFGAV